MNLSLREVFRFTLPIVHYETNVSTQQASQFHQLHEAPQSYGESDIEAGENGLDIARLGKRLPKALRGAVGYLRLVHPEKPNVV